MEVPRNAGRFEYTRLLSSPDEFEIRLIDLQPASNVENPIVCNIRHVQLSEPPRFEALSYVWGPQLPSFTVLSWERRFSVGQNLYDALLALRKTDTVRVLWIDTLCINQDDHVERSSQVRNMRSVYEKATKTLVWLGRADESTDLAFWLLAKSLESAKLMAANNDRRNILQLTQREMEAYQFPLPARDREEFRALKRLLDRPWFQRVWVIQEVAAAADVEVLCGPYSLSWYTFLQALGFLDSRAWIMSSLVREMVQQGDYPPLLRLLWLSKESQATDPRDRVSALCGLAGDASAEGEGGLGVRIDYDPSYTAHQVFRDVTLAMLRRSRDLSVLSAPRVLDEQARFGLPSWVPDWSICHRVMPLADSVFNVVRPALSDPVRDKFTASASTTYLLNVSDDQTHLLVPSIKIDSMKALGSVAEYGKDMTNVGVARMRENCERILSWLTVTEARSRTPYRTGESRIDAFWQTYYGGHFGVSYREAKSLFFEQWPGIQRLCRLIEWGVLSNTSVFNAAAYAQVALMYMSGGAGSSAKNMYLMEVQKFRRMGMSTTGYYCLAPSTAEPGDCIFLLQGGAVPFLLRPCGDGLPNRATLKLVGEVYVHGLMDGEAWEESRCQVVTVA